jgi:hypothetical protein
VSLTSFTALFATISAEVQEAVLRAFFFFGTFRKPRKPMVLKILDPKDASSKMFPSSNFLMEGSLD